MPLIAGLALALALAAAAPATAPAPALAMPDTNIHLYALSQKDGGLALKKRKILSAAPGYENQPSFSPDGRFVLFTAMRDGKQTDIYRYDLADENTEQLTHTAESEYSPRYDADMSHFTVVRVEADGTQRLWRFAADGSAPELLVKSVKPIGYYAFDGQGSVYAFVLGEPHSLQRIDLETETSQLIAKDIGRGLASVEAGGISYVQLSAGQPALHVLREGKDELVASLFKGTEGDYAWLPGGKALLSSNKGSIYHYADAMPWRKVAMNDTDGLICINLQPSVPEGFFSGTDFG